MRTNLPLLQNELLYFTRLPSSNICDYLIPANKTTNATNQSINDNNSNLDEDEIRYKPQNSLKNGTNTNELNTNHYRRHTVTNKRKSPDDHQTIQKQETILAPPSSSKRHHQQPASQQPNYTPSNYYNLLPPPLPPSISLSSPIILKSTNLTNTTPINSIQNFSLNNSSNSNSVTHSSQTAFNNNQNHSSNLNMTSQSSSMQQLVAPAPINPNLHHYHHHQLPSSYYPQHGLALNQANYLTPNPALNQIKMEDLNKWRDIRDKERSFTNCNFN